MPVLRIPVDIEVNDMPGLDKIDAAADEIRRYAFGTVAESILGEPNAGVTQRTAHIHVSTDEQACKYCFDNAIDRVK